MHSWNMTQVFLTRDQFIGFFAKTSIWRGTNDNTEHTSGSLGPCHVTSMESAPSSFTGLDNLNSIGVSSEDSPEDSGSPESFALGSGLMYTPLPP
jgi:hypothetical protein